jgi:UDP-N-acetyl-D-glucosamine dehydrogenase
MAYKPNVGDVRESPALDILELLTRQGGVVSYTDPYVPALAHGGDTLRSVSEQDALAQGADCYVICTNHDAFDYDTIVKRASLIVDTRNALRSYTGSSIFRL